MKVVIAGGTGFLGGALVRALSAGNDFVILSRRPSAPAQKGSSIVAWTPDGSAGPWAAALDGADAVINLAGESIAARRWTDAQKKRILDSRLLATRSLTTAIASLSRPPAVFLSGSAVGYYGSLGDEPAAEDRSPGDDFLARVCVEWEGQAQSAASSRTRVVCVRTGLVLDRRQGALPKMLPPFWFGAGGPVGSGRQYWPWIHLADWVGLVRFAIETPAVSGAVNLTAPNPVTNRDFAKALGRALHRPALIPTPGFALKLLLGEMAQALLLSGQRAIPARAEQLGFRFSYRDLDSALLAIFAR
jgi:uncharacterized protein (TIGR01777 family)